MKIYELQLQLESKAMLLKILNKWLFPDFTNKLTWAVATTGIAMILTPIELRYVLWNWLISTLNIVGVAPLEIPSLENRNDGWGYFLISGALIHNISYKVLAYKMDVVSRDIKRDKRQMDIKLYEQFITLLPTAGLTVQMLQKQDFGQLFHKAAMVAIEEFLSNWEGAEFQFNNQEIELQKRKMFDIIKEFYFKTVEYTGEYNTQLRTVYPIGVDPDSNPPEYIKDQIKTLNGAAIKAFAAHQSFITVCKNKI